MECVIERASTSILPPTGLRFFPNPRACIASYEGSGRAVKIFSFVVSCVTYSQYYLHKYWCVFQRFENQMKEWSVPKEGGFSNRRLVVCLHGLGRNPAHFKKMLAEMRTRDLTQTDIYIPPILEKGSARLDDMVRPILADIAPWAQKEGVRELVFVGISNGARIGRATLVELAKAEGLGNITNIRFISIAGVNRGSSTVSLVHRLGIPYILSEPIVEEMRPESPRTVELDREWEELTQKCSHIGREDFYIASPHDYKVPDYDSTLPAVSGYSAQYAILPWHGHSSVVHAVSTFVTDIVFTEVKTG